MAQRVLLLFLTSFFAVSAWGQRQISGFVHRFGGEVLLTLDSTTGSYYRTKSLREDTKKTLLKLNNGDFIMATAVVDPVQGSVEIDTIDFVGLRQIIGYWNTAHRGQLMNFRSYSDLSVYDLMLQSGQDDLRSSRRQMKYTVVPAQGNEWVMFISDEQETQMGYLNLSGAAATLRLVNSKTGDVTNVLKLQKLLE